MENGDRSDRPTDYTREAWERIVEEVDKLTPSPHERAEQVWQFIRGVSEDLNSNINNYDMAAFCVWYLSFMTDALPYIKPLAKHLNIIFHRFHYQASTELGLIQPKSNEPIRKVPEIRTESPRLSRDYSPE